MSAPAQNKGPLVSVVASEKGHEQMDCKICHGEMRPFLQGIYDDRHGFPGRFDIYRCSVCGFGVTYPELSDSELDSLYTEYYPRQALKAEQVRNMVTPLATWRDRLTIWLSGTGSTCHFSAKPGMKVLDYGCGHGVSLMEIESLGAGAYGIEVDRNVAAVAKQLNLTVHIGSLETAPFQDRFFDFITLSQVLEHIPDPLTLLLQLKNKLKPDGIILLSFPNIDSLSRRVLSSKWLHWHVPYHLNHFSRKSALLLMKDAGLRVTRIRTVTPNVWTVLQLRSLFTAHEEGQRVTSWDQNRFDRKEKAAKSMRRKFLVTTIFAPFNRLTDFVGLGESFVVQATLANSKQDLKS